MPAPATTAAPEAPQHLRALQKANAARLEHAATKKRIKRAGSPAAGRELAACVLTDPPALCANLRVVDLLAAIPRYSAATARSVLHAHTILEQKRLGTLTERQRLALASTLRPPRTRRWPDERLPQLRSEVDDG
jgi:hypothetical protein